MLFPAGNHFGEAVGALAAGGTFAPESALGGALDELCAGGVPGDETGDDCGAPAAGDV